MDTIFLGLIFIFFHFNLNMDGHELALLPNFVGYYLILKGTRSLPESQTYSGMGGLLIGTTAWSGFIWVTGLLGFELYGLISIVPMAVSVTLQLLVTYKLALGVRELEAACQCDLGSLPLQKAWNIAAVLVVLSVVFFWAGWVSALLIAASLVAYMFYLCYFHRARKGYHQTKGVSL